MARELKVNIVGDTRDLERAFTRAERSAKRFNRAIVGALGAGIAGVGFAKIFTDTVKAASNLQEQMSKTNAVFGTSSKEIDKWSKTTATAFGISQRAALETASTFGALFGPLGINGKQAADTSRRLTELGADLASFYNTDVQSALDAIRSGLVGESEPLRKYGALLSETRVQQEAMAATGKKSAASLTDQEKVLARIKIIFEDTAAAQGDSAKTAGNFAGQMKRLQAQAEDLQAALGETLLPSVTELVTQFNKWLADPANKKQVIDGFAASVSALGAAFKFAADTAGALKSAWDKIPNWLPGKNEGLLSMMGGAGTGFVPNIPGMRGPVGTRSRAGAPGGLQGPVGFTGMSGKPVTTLLGQINQFIDKYTGMGKKLADAQKAMAARRAAAQLRSQRIAAGRENVLGWLDFGLERAESTKSNRDNLKVLRRREEILKSWIASSGRTLNLVRELWRTQDQIRNLNKSKSDKDPLAGLMQVSSKRLAQVLAAGTGIGAGGMGRLEANIAGQEIHNYVILDGRQVAHSVNTHQTRGSARTARQTSGFRS